jgi:transposase
MRFVGIDVGKRFVDVCFGTEGKVDRFANEDGGITQILKRLEGHQVEKVVLEASGGYQRQLLAALLGAKYPAIAVNPRQVRDFAKAIGWLEKNDRLDARVLALFAERVRPELRPTVDPALEEVQQWVMRRAQLVGMLAAEKNRSQQATVGGVRRDINAHIDWLKRRLRAMEKELSNLMKKCRDWDAQVELIDKEPGLGRLSSVVLFAQLPELGKLSRRKIAKLVGVAPLCDESGDGKRKRVTWGGRAAVRTCLYMATLTAIRVNPNIRAFYTRLVARGKVKKVAFVAAMRKLLTILNAVVRDGFRKTTDATALAAS